MASTQNEIGKGGGGGGGAVLFWGPQKLLRERYGCLEVVSPWRPAFLMAINIAIVAAFQPRIQPTGGNQMDFAFS